MIRLEDVKENVSEAPQEAPAEETAEQVPQPEEQTPEVPAKQEATERMVPLSVVKEERRKRQELQRQYAELESKQRLSQYAEDPNDLENIMSNPLVQELLIKQAKQELTDFARGELEKYPTLHPSVKKAILSNVRGFVKENTTDVESAKLDIQEWIESVIDEAQEQAPAPKQFQVATTNAPASEGKGSRPAEVAKILSKPIDDWTDEEAALVENYANSK